MEELYKHVKIKDLELEGNIFLAPVAGYSDAPFRSICIQEGASFTYTEMVSSEALVRKNTKTSDLMRRAPNEEKYAVQIFGGNPEVMANAARIVLDETKCECIDINAGCPVPKITKSFSGASLTRDFTRLYEVTKAVVNEVGNEIPVTVKIRLGWDSENLTYKEAALAAIEAGAGAVTLHARTRAQGYAGKADRSALKKLVETVRTKEKEIGRNVCIFASGDIFNGKDAEEVLANTKCDGVMIARAAMGNPFIFREIKNYLTHRSESGIDEKERIQTAFRELSLMLENEIEESACLKMRKKFLAYTKGFKDASHIRSLLSHAGSKRDYERILVNWL